MTTSDPFGPVEGGEARLFTLRSPQLTVRITNFGGRLVSILAPDRDGMVEDVLLGFDDAAAYQQAGGSFGAILGRTANRIADGRFALDGRTYTLARNEPSATLHGGPDGFEHRLWSVDEADPTRLVLSLVSPAGDQGYPGRLAASVTFTLQEGALTLAFEATTDAPTPISLSAHPYFNLAGSRCTHILDHEVEIRADAFLPTDGRQIPTGEIAPVAGTPFDFRSMRTIGPGICEPHPQVLIAKGYDQCFVLQDRGDVACAARVHDPASGRVLEVWTDQPGIQFYTGNMLDGHLAGRGRTFRQSAAFALEPEAFPDAVHHPQFPNTILRPGEIYRRTIQYRLSVAV